MPDRGALFTPRWLSILRGWVRRCPWCRRREFWLMTDESWICHACGAVACPHGWALDLYCPDCVREEATS